jgi:hypothetical protein
VRSALHPHLVVTDMVIRLWVDIRVLPFLALLYMIALIDRLNISAARTAGMGVALVCLNLLPVELTERIRQDGRKTGDS